MATSDTYPVPGAPPTGRASSAPAGLRVVHVVLSMDFGGLERVVLSLVREGKRLGQQPAVVCLERPGTLASAVESLGVPLRCLQKPSGKSVKTFGRIEAVFADLRPDVVHTHQIGALFYAGPAARRFARVLVHTEHGKHYGGSWRKRVLGWCTGWRADRFFCVSTDIAEEVCSHFVARRRRVVVVPNGVDIDCFNHHQDREARRQAWGIGLGCPVVGTVGRLSEIKCHDLLIGAFSRLRAQVPNAHLLIVGDGPARSALESLAAKLGLAECVHFAGYQSRPEDFLDLMDVFALSSRSEGLPVTVLEAWAARVPVVATAVGGLPELLNGAAGLLVPFGDEQALSEALEQTLCDPSLAGRLRDRGQQRVRSGFTLTRMAENYQRHYLELLHDGARNGDAS